MDPKEANLLLKHENLANILVEFEDLLDSLDIYVFDNWYEGEIYSGPEVKRYWVNVSLIYPYKQMPDPAGAVRLQKNNINVEYDKIKVKKTVQTDKKEGNRIIPNHHPKEIEETFWVVSLKIPRKFITELDDDDLQLYSDAAVDKDNVSDARDQNVDNKDAFMDNDVEGEGDEFDTGEEF